MIESQQNTNQIRHWLIANKKILAVVPARGGNRAYSKNLRQLVVKSSFRAHVIRQVPAVDRSVVSTDNEQIAGEAERAGISLFGRNEHW